MAAVAILVVRCLVLVGTTSPSRPLTGDEPIYEKLAHGLLEGRGYTKDGKPYIQKPPGWPGVLAGLHLVAGENRRVFVLAQALFDAATAVLAGWTASRIFGTPSAGAIAFLLVALWPPFLRESRLLQTEPMYTAGLTAVLAAFTAFVQRPRVITGLLMGLAAGVAVLARPTGLVPTFGLVLGWLLIRRRHAWPDALKLAGLALGIALVLTPWGLRNQRVFGHFIPTGVGAGDLFWVGSMPETDGRWDHDVWMARKREIVAAEEARLGRPVDPLEEDALLMAEGKRNWQRDPAGSVLRSVKRLYRLVLVPVATSDRAGLRWLFLGALLVLYALALPRAIEGLFARDAHGSIPGAMLCAIVLTVGVSSMFLTNSRFFEPLRPMFLVLAAGTLAKRKL
jgi:4-amino-4-deoxy-L-arabinose transferase-like glycosyltransferase